MGRDRMFERSGLARTSTACLSRHQNPAATSAKRNIRAVGLGPPRAQPISSDPGRVNGELQK